MLTISTDKSLLNIPLIHHYLSTESYWAKNIPIEIVKTAIENSLCFGVYIDGQQMGFARLITDYATFGYLADVFVLADYRGKGYSKALMAEILAHPSLQGLRVWGLRTADAHGLYAQYGFSPLAKPERGMERVMFTAYSAH